MLFIKYLLMTIGVGLLLAAAAILVQDIYRILMARKRGERGSAPEEGASPYPTLALPSFDDLRWKEAGKLAVVSAPFLLLGMSIVLVPSGSAGVRVSQFAGTRPGTLYPGVHWVPPMLERVELFNIRDNVFSTVLVADPKKAPEALRVQTKEGLTVGLAITVRYRLDPEKLPHIYSELPQPVEQEIVPPVVASVFREMTPNYMVREIFATKREEVQHNATEQIRKKLAADGIVLKEVMLRDIQLPAEYAKGLEGLLLKEQENERLSVELEVKQKEVRAAELEAEAQKAREVKAAEARAAVVVLEAKAQADAMQHTLPLKEKQIQQAKLEADARKESTVKNAEAMAQAKVIDSKAELEKRKMMAEGEEYQIRRVAAADAEKMRLEADVLKDNPLLIQKIIAEKLSDKVQIMMVPADGKYFFANDVIKGMLPTTNR